MKLMKSAMAHVAGYVRKPQNLANLAVITLLIMIAATGQARADALDDATTKFAAFLTKAGNAVVGFGGAAGGLAVAGIGIRRMVAKSAGDEEVMARSNNHILDVLKYTAMVAGSGLIARIGGEILK